MATVASSGAHAPEKSARRRKVLIRRRKRSDDAQSPDAKAASKHTRTVLVRKAKPPALPPVQLKGAQQQLSVGRLGSWGAVEVSDDLLASQRNDVLSPQKDTARTQQTAQQTARTDLTESDLYSKLRSHLRHARRLEQARTRKETQALLPQDRIRVTQDKRALATYRKRIQEWNAAAERMARKVHKDPRDLVFNRTDETRFKMEQRDLLGRVIPANEKYGSDVWRQTLRGGAQSTGITYVRVGNMFSGLYCPVKPDAAQPVMPTIRRPTSLPPLPSSSSEADPADSLPPPTYDESPRMNTPSRTRTPAKSSGRRSKKGSPVDPTAVGDNRLSETRFMRARRKQLKTKIHSLRPGDLDALDSLVIVGTDLFALDPPQEPPSRATTAASSAAAPSVIPVGFGIADIRLTHVSLDALDEHDQKKLREELTDDIATQLKVSPHQVLVTDLKAGSVIATVKLFVADPESSSHVVFQDFGARDSLDQEPTFAEFSSVRDLLNAFHDAVERRQGTVLQHADPQYFEVQRVVEDGRATPAPSEPASEADSRNSQEMIDGPACVLDAEELAMECELLPLGPLGLAATAHAECSATATAELHNTGSCALYFRWVSQNATKASSSSSRAPVFSCSRNVKGVLLPGQRLQCSFQFQPDARSPGTYLDVFELECVPPLAEPVALRVRGIGSSADHLSVQRQQLTEEIQRQEAELAAQEVMQNILDSIRPTPPPPSEWRRLFYVRNPPTPGVHGRLHFHNELFRNFQHTAKSAISMQKPLERDAAEWDFSAVGLRKLIENMSDRHADTRESMLNYWQHLVLAASNRPTLNPDSRKTMKALLTAVVSDVVRFGSQNYDQTGLSALAEETNELVADTRAELESAERARIEEEKQAEEERRLLAGDNNDDDAKHDEQAQDASAAPAGDAGSPDEQAGAGSDAGAQQDSAQGAGDEPAAVTVTMPPLKDIVGADHVAQLKALEKECRKRLLAQVRGSVLNAIQCFELIIATDDDGEYLKSFNKLYRDHRRRVRGDNPRLLYWGDGLTEPFSNEVLDKECVLGGAAGTTHSLVLTSDQRVYVWRSQQDTLEEKKAKGKAKAKAKGKGKKGKGADEEEEEPSPVRPELATPLLWSPLVSARGVEALSCGMNYSLAVTTAGELFSWDLAPAPQESKDKDSVPLQSVEEKHTPLRRLLPDREVVRVACGSRLPFSLAVDVQGRLYSWAHSPDAVKQDAFQCGVLGQGEIAQFGAGKGKKSGGSKKGKKAKASGAAELTDEELEAKQRADVQKLLTPALVESLKDEVIVRVAAGGRHCLALTENGTVYSWGAAASSALGEASKQDRLVPQALAKFVDDDDQVVDIVCGDAVSAALTRKGAVYTWGAAGSALGHGAKKDQKTPKRVDALKDVVVERLTGGLHHILALAAGDSLYSWGQGAAGCLGHGDDAAAATPKEIETLLGMGTVDLIAGGTHSMVMVTKMDELEEEEL